MMSLLQITFEVSDSVNGRLHFEWEVVYLATWIGWVHQHDCILWSSVSMSSSYETGMQLCTLYESRIDCDSSTYGDGAV